MILSIGPLLSEISTASETSAVGRLLPLVLLAFGVLAVVAVVLGLRNLKRPDDDNTDAPGD